jgi:phosphohistidine phosphatase
MITSAPGYVIGMKRLTLVRHAKSSWKETGLTDHDRPLNKRGKHDAPMMGERLRDQGVSPDLLLSSTAKRARKTAEVIAAAIGYPPEAIAYDERLYLGSVDELLEAIRDLDDDKEHVMLFGHNPGFTALANRVGDATLENLPTCGVYSVELAIDRWKDVGEPTGRLWLYDFPKRIPERG